MEWHDKLRDRFTIAAGIDAREDGIIEAAVFIAIRGLKLFVPQYLDSVEVLEVLKPEALDKRR